MEKLISLRENVDWEIKAERHEFFRQLDPLIVDWKAPLPNLRDFFRPEEIERLLSHCINYSFESRTYHQGQLFVRFAAATGYRYEPKVDENDGEPLLLLRRTTALHQAARVLQGYRAAGRDVIRELFKIYDIFDANYVDESGFTHFHAACMFDCDVAAKRFLELGQDPNCVWRETGEAPLHLALSSDGSNVNLLEWLMKSGANPNLANAEGSTPFHIISKKHNDSSLLKMMLELSYDKYRPMLVSARDKLGNTPLHLALRFGNRDMVEWLLRNGADPNSANKKGLTPLHVTYRNYDLLVLFFKINDEKRQPIQVDVPDDSGRTPLQWAVANMSLNTVDILLDHGADLSNFVFPSASDFNTKFVWSVYADDFQLRLASGLLAVVERLERKGYETNRRDAMAVMRLFAHYELFPKPEDLKRRWYDNKKFAQKAKKIRTRDNDESSSSLHDLIRARPEEAAKLFAITDYHELAGSRKLSENIDKRYRDACALHLCETMSRRFFRRWAPEALWELTRYRLPILCCDMIAKQLNNEDLHNICLANDIHVRSRVYSHPPVAPPPLPEFKMYLYAVGPNPAHALVYALIRDFSERTERDSIPSAALPP
ncbi:unnamed protein product [Trichogramma brassicae]|uniref:Uncharacterized protein n=1 Tax=Trichogramma brassicae TaxID=86971 RepID=A0A6H5IGI7_9HYME|nr:unnamed protein product [Trichogramma brassicae]